MQMFRYTQTFYNCQKFQTIRMFQNTDVLLVSIIPRHPVNPVQSDISAHTDVLVHLELVNRTIVSHLPVSTMTLSDLTDILDENSAVEDYSVKEDGVRFWIGVRAYKESKQAAIDEIEGLDDVDLELEKNENDWYWYFASITQ